VNLVEGLNRVKHSKVYVRAVPRSACRAGFVFIIWTSSYRDDVHDCAWHDHRPDHAGQKQHAMEDYLEAADTLIVLTTFRLLAGFLLVVFLIKRPRALLYGAGSILALSFVVFFRG
jgi:hypothetical protein